jgi:hypothetical protein
LVFAPFFAMVGIIRRYGEGKLPIIYPRVT